MISEVNIIIIVNTIVFIIIFIIVIINISYCQYDHI